MTKYQPKHDLQQDLIEAHAECRRDDESRRRINRLVCAEWDAKGGSQAEELHFDWLRTQPVGRAV